MPSGQDPAEGDRKLIERELARQDSTSTKNPEREAEKPGGIPTQTVKGSASPKPAGPEGQQGKSHSDAAKTLQRGN
jgi:hypothetical protein